MLLLYTFKSVNSLRFRDLMNVYPQQLNKLLEILEETHASNTIVLDVHDITSITDYMIITTGRSSRNTKAIAEIILEQPKNTMPKVLAISGMELGEWVLIDFGDFILHIMQEHIRENYNLEALWKNDLSNKP